MEYGKRTEMAIFDPTLYDIQFGNSKTNFDRGMRRKIRHFKAVAAEAVNRVKSSTEFDSFTVRDNFGIEMMTVTVQRYSTLSASVAVMDYAKSSQAMWGQCMYIQTAIESALGGTWEYDKYNVYRRVRDHRD